MREIKFSYIWQHRETGRFIEHFYDIETIEAGLDYDYDYRRLNEMVARRQWTGLKDKNSVDLFDSDIAVDEYGRKVQIIWNVNGHWGIKLMPTGEIYSIGDYWKYEVIGNIYSNPELLNNGEGDE